MTCYPTKTFAAGSSWYYELKSFVAMISRVIMQYNVFSPTKLYPLGECVGVSRDKEVFYIKIDVDLIYEGHNIFQMRALHNDMKNEVNKFLHGLTIQQAKEDYIDRFLHKDIKKKINDLLNRVSGSSLRIINVFISDFLIN